MAWIVLLTSFLLFCVFCAVSSVGLHYFLFQSTVSLHTVFQPGRGTPGVREGTAAERTVRSNQDLFPGAFVRTDTTDDSSQATIIFEDTSGSDELIAFVTLKGDTSLLLQRASRPRFSWSVPDYQIELVDVTGEIEVEVVDNLSRSLRLNIWTIDGTRIIIDESGHYIISLSDALTHIVNRSGDGDAIVIPPGRDAGRLLLPENRAEIRQVTGDMVVRPYFANLISNSGLQVIVSESTSDGNTFLRQPPTEWNCTHQSDEPSAPLGRYGVDTSPDGRRTFHFFRGEGAISHGDTICTYTFPTDARDVSNYTYLELRTTLYINYQSVNACGEQATECPLMLQVNYIAEDGGDRVWTHGIYAVPSNVYPLLCDTCFDNHVRIYPNAWYTYESGNLFDIIAPPQILANQPGARPSEIRSIRVYASGHQYDVFVSEVSLLAGDITTNSLEEPVTSTGNG